MKPFSIIIPYKGRFPQLVLNLRQLSSQHDPRLRQGEVVIVTDGADPQVSLLGGMGFNLNIRHMVIDLSSYKYGTPVFHMAIQMVGTNCAIRACESEKIITTGPEIIPIGETLQELLDTPMPAFAPTILVHWDVNNLPIVNDRRWYSYNKQPGRPDSIYICPAGHQYHLNFLASFDREVLLAVNGLYNEYYCFSAGYGDVELIYKLFKHGFTAHFLPSAFAIHIDHSREGEYDRGSTNGDRFHFWENRGIIERNVVDWGNVAYIKSFDTVTVAQ